jgi:hypothetical protein
LAGDDPGAAARDADQTCAAGRQPARPRSARPRGGGRRRRRCPPTR